MAMTLEELKAQNAVDETEAVDVEAEEVEEVEAEEESEQEVVETDETSEEEDSEEASEEESEVEAWQLEDEQASDDGEKRFTDSDVAAAKRKLKAKIEKRDDEIAELKSQIEKLRTGRVEQPSSAKKPMPKLEDHDYDEGKYQSAMEAWVRDQVADAAQSHKSTESQTKAQKQIEQSVESHYERAAKLTAEHGIDDTVYRGADLAVRQTIESVFEGSGDIITDSLIARMGEGSEKVMYALGRSAEKREKLRAKLLEDPNGLSAVMYLGELKAEITKPVKRVTNAPKPAKRATGGSGGSNKEDTLRRKYQKESDMQARFNLRREAKAQGFDVSKW